LINKIAVIVTIVLLLFICIGTVKASEVAGDIIVESVLNQPELWLIEGNNFLHYPTEEEANLAEKMNSSFDRKQAADLIIYISSPTSVMVSNPYTYHFTDEQDAKIWAAYKTYAENYIAKNIKKKGINKNTSPILAVPIEAKVSKDGLVEIKTKPKKVIEREQNNKGIVLMIVIFFLGIETFFLVGLFTSKNFRKIIFRNNG